MSDQHEVQKVAGLPDNAYNELKPGEHYEPIMSPNKTFPEVTVWSVLWGLLMAILFSGAAAYLGFLLLLLLLDFLRPQNVKMHLARM